MSNTKEKQYVFGHFSAMYYKGIMSHSIEVYTTKIKAKDDIEALVKMNKKADVLIRFNKCFKEKDKIPVCIYEDKKYKMGIAWLKDNLIKWEGDIIYWGNHTFDNPIYMQTFKLPTCQYGLSNKDWIANYAGGYIYPSFCFYFKHVWDYFGGNRDKQSLFKDRKQDLQKYFFDKIDETINNEKFPLNEKKALLELKQSKLI
jgi:hypothetical protein